MVIISHDLRHPNVLQGGPAKALREGSFDLSCGFRFAPPAETEKNHPNGSSPM